MYDKAPAAVKVRAKDPVGKGPRSDNGEAPASLTPTTMNTPTSTGGIALTKRYSSRIKFSGNVLSLYSPFIWLPRTRSLTYAPNYSRTPKLKAMHRPTITACYPKTVVGQPKTLGSLPSMSQGHINGQEVLEIREENTDIPPSDAQRRTIYALSTPPGKAGVAVIRISGPNALDVWQAMVDAHTLNKKKGKGRDIGPAAWKMHRCKVVHPQSKEVLDDGLAVFFRGSVYLIEIELALTSSIGPKSFTAEDVLELHVHSGRAVIASVLDALACLPYCRLAEPGEFTRRAFFAGRLDLTQVEGLKDLINANTESQRKLALRATEVG